MTNLRKSLPVLPESAHVAFNLDLAAHESVRRIDFAGIHPDKGLPVGGHRRDAAGQAVGLLDGHRVVFTVSFH